MKDTATIVLGAAVILMVLAFVTWWIVYMAVSANDCEWQHELERRDLIEFIIDERGNPGWQWKPQ